jgi:hypothetical protein
MNAPSHFMSSRPPNTTSSTARLRISDDGFVADAVVDSWVRSGDAVRAGGLLSLRDGRRYLVRDAVRVLGRRNGETDPYGFTGRVESIRELLRQGAVAFADGIRLGPAVYDVEYGVVAIPFASPDESGANPAIR